MTIPRWISATLALSAVLWVGCTPKHSHSTEPVAWPDNLNNLSFVWTGAPNIDLTTGPVVPVRAFVESVIVSGFGGSDNYLYPGFDDATTLRPELRGGTETIGTITSRILAVNRVGDDVDVSGCTYSYRAAVLVGQDKKGQDEFAAVGAPLGAPEAGVSAFEMTMTAPKSEPVGEVSQQGAQRAPADDVFDGYKITGYRGGLVSAKDSDSVWQRYTQATAECVAAAPEPLDRRRDSLSNSTRFIDFPMSRPTPGWPAAPSH